MDEKVLGLLSQINSVPSLTKMGQVEGLIKQYGFSEGSAADLVPALCKLVMSNMDKHPEVVQFVAHVIEAAMEAGPQIEKLLKDNAETIASLLGKAE